MVEKIIDKPIADIIHESFIEYAKEVIEDRALPDVRDGLKPVQRRILYTMYQSGFTPDKPFRKSAATVGEVLKNLHPHGDASVYNALVKMAQTFNRRYTLVDGHGNFGTTDDSPAAMRYTESRLSPIAMEMLKYIDKDVVEWTNNYDDTMKEPAVLPSMIPNLLVNGGSGIAVGVASNIPPHNLEEVIDGICAYIKNPKISTKGLMKYIKGPDFPTGGVVSPEGLFKCFDKGVGTAVIRGKVVIEELPGEKKQLVVTEIPYRVSKNNLLSKMARLIEEEGQESVIEIRDESNINGIRIVIEMSKEGDAGSLLKKLYDKTPLQTNFNYNVVALVNNKPKQLSLKEAIHEFVEHKKEVIKRRVKYDLDKAKSRLHILEGLLVAIDTIDEIINIIRKSKNITEARKTLRDRIGLTAIQVQAILDLRLQKLTVLEGDALRKELGEVTKKIKELESVLKSEENILNELVKELLDIKKKHPSQRKTLIKRFDEVKVKTKVERFTLQINSNKTVRKLSSNYRGNRGLTLKTDSTKRICIFDADGKIIKITGITIPNIVDAKVLAMCNEDEVDENSDVIFVTTDGFVKKSAFSEYVQVKGDCQALKLNKDAKVASIIIGSELKDMVIVTKKGFVIRIDHTTIRQIGRVGIGVRGIRLEENDEVVGAVTIPEDNSKTILVKTDLGTEKIQTKEIQKQGRGGKGSKLLKGDKIIKLIGAK